MPPTGDLAHNPAMCPNWESNQRPFGSWAGAQSTEPHQPELLSLFYSLYVLGVRPVVSQLIQSSFLLTYTFLGKLLTSFSPSSPAGSAEWHPHPSQQEPPCLPPQTHLYQTPFPQSSGASACFHSSAPPVLARLSRVPNLQQS